MAKRPTDVSVFRSLLFRAQGPTSSGFSSIIVILRGCRTMTGLCLLMAAFMPDGNWEDLTLAIFPFLIFNALSCRSWDCAGARGNFLRKSPSTWSWMRRSGDTKVKNNKNFRTLGAKSETSENFSKNVKKHSLMFYFFACTVANFRIISRKVGLLGPKSKFPKSFKGMSKKYSLVLSFLLLHRQIFLFFQQNESNVILRSQLKIQPQALIPMCQL